jgi:two-component system chemotaxis sensor kinase CheA
MDDFELELKTEFISEALMNLEEAEQAFMELETSTNPSELLNKIFRLAHNLKGGSRAVGFADVAEFTHQLENLVLKLKEGQIALSALNVTTLLKSNDRLAQMLSGLKENLDARFQNDDLIAEIQGWLNPSAAPAAPELAPVAELSLAEAQAPSVAGNGPNEEPMPEVPAANDAGFEENPFFSGELPENLLEASARTGPAPVTEEPARPELHLVPPPAAPTPSAPAPEAASKKTSASEKDELVRVSLSKIEDLNNYVGELIILQSVLQAQATDAQNPLLSASIHQISKLSKEIQELSMSLRMFPIKPVFQKMNRVVRDTAQAVKKDVLFETRGEDLEVDKTVIDQIGDPLVHILRNAVDHGLEASPDDRVKAGKSAKGNVTLHAFNEGNQLVIEVRDDGKGIDPKIIREKAVQKGVIRSANGVSDQEAIMLIFHPGFSTKSETSEISGRGVGMDVVKTNIEAIGGKVHVTSVVGVGSTFRIVIPLSLAVLDGMVVAAGPDKFVVPLNQVHETLNLSRIKVFNMQGVGECFELRGTVIPLYSLADRLKKGPGAKSTERLADKVALLVKTKNCIVGIAVDDVMSTQQIVVKPLGEEIAKQKGWLGSCILGDGRPSLIVNMTELFEADVTLKNWKDGEAA